MPVGMSNIPSPDPYAKVGNKVSVGEPNQTFTSYVVKPSNSARSQLMSGANSIGKSIGSTNEQVKSFITNLFGKDKLQKMSDNPSINKAMKFAGAQMFKGILSKNKSEVEEAPKQTAFEKTLAGWRGELEESQGSPLSKEGKLSSLTNLLSIVKQELDRNQVGINEPGIPPKSEIDQSQILAQDIQAAMEKLKS